MRFLLDEDLPPDAAVIARGVGIDVISVHAIGRNGYSDEAQLQYAASEERILVTRNRDDFIALTRTFYATNQPHHGVLIVPRSLPNHQPHAIAQALQRWAQRYGYGSPGVGFVDFL